MAGASLEIVLMKQLASCLAVPILVVDQQLDLVFFNESAEPILGRRFEETGAIQRSEWSSVFRTTDASGAAIPPEKRPLAIAIDRHKPAHSRFGLTGLDGVARQVEGISFPLETERAGLVGAVSIFWEVSEQPSAAPPADDARKPSTLSGARRRGDPAAETRHPTADADPDGRARRTPRVLQSRRGAAARGPARAFPTACGRRSGTTRSSPPTRTDRPWRRKITR